MTREESLLTLLTHKDKLSAATTFEEYREAHIAYVDMLIDTYELEGKRQDRLKSYWTVVSKKPAAQDDDIPF